MKEGYSLHIPMSAEQKAKVKAAAKEKGYTLGGLAKKLLCDFAEGQNETAKEKDEDRE